MLGNREGGYVVKRSLLDCVVCRELAMYPLELSCCGRVICRGCYQKVSYQGCPNCGRRDFRAIESPALRRMIDEMPTNCPDCRVELTYGMLETHRTSDCPCRRVVCLVPNCKAEMEYSGALRHVIDNHSGLILERFIGSRNVAGPARIPMVLEEPIPPVAPVIPAMQPVTQPAPTNGSIVFRARGKYLTALRDGGSEWNRDRWGEWESFVPERRGDGKIAFKTFHGKYVSAQPNGTLKMDRDRPEVWEWFTVEAVPGTRFFSVQSHHGKYLSAKSKGGAACDSNWIGEGEQIELPGWGGGSPARAQVAPRTQAAPQGTVAFSVNGKFLSARPDGTADWNGEVRGESESFTVVPLKEGMVAFRTCRGRYLSAQRNGNLEANRDQINAWERFVVVSLGGRTFSIRTHDGKYLSARPGGLAGCAEAVGPGERIEILDWNVAQ